MAWWDDVAGEIGVAVGSIFGGNNRDIIVPAEGNQNSTTTYPNVRGGPSDMQVSQSANSSRPVYGTSNNSDSAVSKIMAALGVDAAYATRLLQIAPGDSNLQKTLAAIGIEPYASMHGMGSGSGGGGGGGGAGRVLFPEELAQIRAETDRVIAQTGVFNNQSRQIGALFDPNYPDGALITLPDGTQRINGTEIILDTRERGQFKPVSNAPGYFVDPITGVVIDTNGNQIRREELQETIRSNQAREAISQAEINAAVESARNRLALDTVVDVGDLNLRAATSENEQKLRSALETNRLNLEGYLGAGDLNIGATNAETNRLNALTNRTAAGGQLALGQQELQDARTRSVIELASNPQNFVQREYETRALLAPPGYTGPAYQNNPLLSQAAQQLINSVPDVGGLLPTYQAPVFQEPVLPNASLPRVTAPTYTQLETNAQNLVPKKAPVENRPATQAETAAYLDSQPRGQPIPQWARDALGFALGTKGTKEREFIVGDPQVPGVPNPEFVRVHNPAPDTEVEVIPSNMLTFDDFMRSQLARAVENMKDSKLSSQFDDQNVNAAGVDDRRGKSVNSASTKGPDFGPGYYDEDVEFEDGSVGPRMPRMPQMEGGLGKLLADVLINISNQWGPMGGMAQYAYGTSPAKNIKDLYANAYMQDGQMLFRNNGNNNYQNNQNNNSNNNPVNAQPVNQQSNVNTSGNSGQTSMSAPNGGNFDPRFGPQDSQGNFLGVLTANTDQAIQNMPAVRYAQDYARNIDFNQLGINPVNAAFGVTLPDVGGLNLRQLNDWRLDPDVWGTMSSLYRSGNRNLDAIYQRVLANAPRGNALTTQTAIRT